MKSPADIVYAAKILGGLCSWSLNKKWKSYFDQSGIPKGRRNLKKRCSSIIEPIISTIDSFKSVKFIFSARIHTFSLMCYLLKIFNCINYAINSYCLFNLS